MSIDRNRFTTGRRPALMRGADGKLRPDSGDHEIADVWAEQRRISLAESLAEDRRRAAKDRIKRERGLVGLAAVELRILVRRTRIILFGTRSVQKPQAQTPTPASQGSTATGKTALAGRDAAARRNAHTLTSATNGTAGKLQAHQSQATKKPANGHDNTKNVEITLALPSLSKLSPTAALRRLRSLLSWLAVTLHRLPRKAALAATGLAVLAVAAVITLNTNWIHLPRTSSPGSKTTDSKTSSAVSGNPAALQKGTPTFRTLLPAGKDINQLGGWRRISPPDRDPVYAFPDKIGRVDIAISEQPLPANFKRDPNGSVADLAKSYSATDSLKVKDTEVHIGTSAKGPQSVIFTANGLLVLIKSEAPVSNDQWSQYVSSLQ